MSSLDKYERTTTTTSDRMIIKVLQYITPSLIIILTAILLSS